MVRPVSFGKSVATSAAVMQCCALIVFPLMVTPMAFIFAWTSGGSFDMSGILGASPPIVTVTLHSPTLPWLANAVPTAATNETPTTLAMATYFERRRIPNPFVTESR